MRLGIVSDTQTFTIAFNQRAGTVLAMGEDAVRAMIERSGIKVREVLFLPPEDINAALQTLHDGGNRVLLGGGDGTILKAAETMQENGAPIGFLPLGTMNLLVQDLGIPVNLEQALRAYAQGARAETIDIAEVNGHPFLCAAGIGVMPEASEFRESLRDIPSLFVFPRMSMFVFNQLSHLNRRRFRITMNKRNKKLRTTSIVVSNNRFSRSEAGFKKASLQDGILEIYSATPKSIWERLRLLIRLSAGLWKSDPVMRRWLAREAVIHSHKTEELVSLDGETVTLRTPLHFKMHRQAFNVLVPQDTGEPS